MTRNELHRRLAVAEAAVGHLSRLQWRKAGRSGGSAGRGLLLARIDRLERAIALAANTLDSLKVFRQSLLEVWRNILSIDISGEVPVEVELALVVLSAALGESDWRGEDLPGWDGEEELSIRVALPKGSEVVVDGGVYRLEFERVLRRCGTPPTERVLVGRPLEE